MINIVIFLASMFKFIQILQINWNLSNVSLTIFTFFTSLLMILILNYGKYYSEEQQKSKELYRELKAYADQVRELTRTEERNHLAMEIHDSIGHTMTGLIMELEMCKRVIPQNQEQGIQLIQHALDTARKGFIEIRSSVDVLKAETSQSEKENWVEMIHRFRNQTGLNIHVSLDPEKIQLPASIASVVYRILQETLTNAARHSHCTTVNITIQKKKDSLYMKILDNGEACNPYVEGNGLKGMRKRVEGLNGSIAFSQTPGFCVEVCIPVNLKSNKTKAFHTLI
ncbi:sensor histidine kinase [Anaerosolibacter carboniphilus]|nr:sensor histidine kinase [Anaerosolibacter carboniphilus]